RISNKPNPESLQIYFIILYHFSKKSTIPGEVARDFFRKHFLTLLWILPTIALPSFVVEKISRKMNPAPPAQPELVKVPDQVLNAGEKAKIVYIELETRNVPEPSALLLLPLSALALLRRRR